MCAARNDVVDVIQPHHPNRHELMSKFYLIKRQFPSSVSIGDALHAKPSLTLEAVNGTTVVSPIEEDGSDLLGGQTLLVPQPLRISGLVRLCVLYRSSETRIPFCFFIMRGTVRVIRECRGCPNPILQNLLMPSSSIRALRLLDLSERFTSRERAMGLRWLSRAEADSGTRGTRRSCSGVMETPCAFPRKSMSSST